jgi:hypothetical protein
MPEAAGQMALASVLLRLAASPPVLATITHLALNRCDSSSNVVKELAVLAVACYRCIANVSLLSAVGRIWCLKSYLRTGIRSA